MSTTLENSQSNKTRAQENLIYLFIDVKSSCFKQEFDEICVPLTDGYMQTRHTLSVLQVEKQRLVTIIYNEDHHDHSCYQYLSDLEINHMNTAVSMDRTSPSCNDWRKVATI